MLKTSKEVYVSGGMEDKALRVSCDAVSFIDAIESKHEEADTRILLHLAHVTSPCVRKVVVVSPDTDV